MHCFCSIGVAATEVNALLEALICRNPGLEPGFLLAVSSLERPEARQ